MIWTWFFVFVLCEASEFKYYHDKSRRIFSIESRPEANFGYSISSMSSGSKSKLVVGAPLADNIGNVYTCDLTDNNANSCISVKRDIVIFKDYEAYSHQKYWFGATVKGTNDFFVGCAPLHIETDATLFQDYPLGTYGQCFMYRDPRDNPIKLNSLAGKKRKEGFTKFEDTIDSFGWSLFIDSQDSILIGGPAMISGRVIKVDSRNVLKSYFNGTSSGTEFNFGYGVASSETFLEQTEPRPIIAVGSTYGYLGHGQVSFIQESIVRKKKGRAIEQQVLGAFEGSSIGSMFGAVLCPAKLTASRLTDLLVGAPTFAGDSYNTGAVYVYIAKGTTVPTLRKTIVGFGSQSYFGNAIVNLGDLNGDTFDDIAIGAPYEGRGAVYLYSGAELARAGEVDSAVPHLQRILPEPALRTFGYSLTAINDYDDNGCSELAIGAPESNTVTVLRCMAEITVVEIGKLKNTLMGTKNGLSKTEELLVCITVKFPIKPTVVKTDILVKVVIEHDGASLKFPKDGVLTFNINRHKTMLETYCQNITLFISGTKGDYNKHVAYTLSASLVKDLWNEKDFQSYEVILNKDSALLTTGSVWIQECGGRNCEPKLKMTTTFSETSPYTIGSSSSIDVTMEVVNSGEVAYDACARVSVRGASVPRPPDACRALRAPEQLECRPRQLLRKTNLPWSLEAMSIDTSKLTNKDKSIEVNITLYNVCASQKVTEQDHRVYYLFADALSVVTDRRTDEGISNIVNLTRSDIAVQKVFEHIYTISNNGSTNWVNVSITVIVEKQDFVTAKSVYLEDGECQLENITNSEDLTFSCLASKLDSHMAIDVKLLLQVVADNINDRIGKEKLTVQSNLTVDLDGFLKTDSITSELRLDEVSVPIWIIIVACILALIVLVIIFFVLRECGFLKRKNKEQLKRVRMSVRRQTMIRQSMNRPRSNDQERLVADEAASSQDIKKTKRDRRVVVKDP